MERVNQNKLRKKKIIILKIKIISLFGHMDKTRLLLYYIDLKKRSIPRYVDLCGHMGKNDFFKVITSFERERGQKTNLNW